MSAIYAALEAIERWVNRLQVQADTLQKTVDQVLADRAAGVS